MGNNRNRNRVEVPGARAALDHLKTEVASELGIPNYDQLDLGALPSRLNGKVGGLMVRKMIEFAEHAMQGSPQVVQAIEAEPGATQEDIRTAQQSLQAANNFVQQFNQTQQQPGQQMTAGQQPMQATAQPLQAVGQQPMQATAQPLRAVGQQPLQAVDQQVLNGVGQALPNPLQQAFPEGQMFR